jgi:hypothetical protein
MDALLHSILIIWYRNAGLKGASVENTLVFWCTVLTVGTSPPVVRERQKFIALLRASPDPDLSTSVLQLRNISLPWPAAYPSACLPVFRGMSVPRVPADVSLVHEDPTCEKHACVPCRAVPCHAMNPRPSVSVSWICEEARRSASYWEKFVWLSSSEIAGRLGRDMS